MTFWFIVADFYYSRTQKKETPILNLKKTSKNIKNGLETKKIQQKKNSNIFAKNLDFCSIFVTRILTKCTRISCRRSHTHPPDPPGTGSFLDARQLGSPLKVPRALPPVLPVVLVGGALLYFPVVLDGPAPEDVRVVGGY